MKRKIVRIDEEKCNGCGQCVPSCAEGAIGIVDGRARLIGDRLCDGLGACLGECPRGAISIEEREAGAFEATAASVHENAVCPGGRMMTIARGAAEPGPVDDRAISELGQWPVQLALVSPGAPYFKNADLLIAADCVPFAVPDFHRRFLRGRAVAVGCPKLDDAGAYIEKLSEIIRRSDLSTITVVHMEVPCCFGLSRIVQAALALSGGNVPVEEITVGLDGSVTPAQGQGEGAGSRLACAHDGCGHAATMDGPKQTP